MKYYGKKENKIDGSFSNSKKFATNSFRQVWYILSKNEEEKNKMKFTNSFITSITFNKQLEKKHPGLSQHVKISLYGLIEYSNSLRSKMCGVKNGKKVYSIQK